MQSPRLVASDVDGTLLGADETPSVRTRRVVARMVDAGVPLVLATGRPPRWIPRVCEAIGVHGLVVAANGAVLYDAAQDRVLDTRTLGGAALTEVVAGLREAVPGCRVAVERVGTGAFDRLSEQFVAERGYLHVWPHPDHSEIDPDGLDSEPVIKVLARHPSASSDVMADAVRRALGHHVDVTFSAFGGLVECSARGITKADGLARAAEHLGVAQADVVAFGDMPNDREMLRWAGHGVAMGNAHPILREEADEVTASNLDDGVASVLERWF